MKYAARLLLTIATAYFFIARVSQAAPAPAGVSAEYVDSKLCAGCHPQIARSFAATGMGRSAYRPSLENMKEDFEHQNTVYHSLSDRYYTMLRQDGKFYERRHTIGYDGKQSNVVEKQIDLVIGSGNHAHTYAHRNADGTLVELPVSWYAEKGGAWGMSPGYDRRDQEEFRRPVLNDCVFCHNAYPLTLKPPKNDEDVATLTDGVQNGIGCQRCHGPGRNHVAAASSGHASTDEIRRAIVNPAKLSRDLQMDVCMQCHLETTSSPLPGSIPRFDRAPFSYHPGEPLGAYAIYFDRSPEAQKDDRFEIAHAAYRLRKSECFAKSQMTCTTCHNPHEASDAPAAVEHYQAVCRGCHQAAHAAARPAGNCTDCHMPKRRAEDAVHVVMTDHYIRKEQPRRDLLAPLDEMSSQLSKYQGPVSLYYPAALDNPADRNLYLSLAQVEEGADFQTGLPEFAKAIAAYAPKNSQFTFELARAYGMSGQTAKAVSTLVECLRLKPDWLKAQRELVADLFAEGEMSRAVTVIQQSLRPGKGDATLLTNLGNAYLHQNKALAAEQALRRALEIEPELPEANNLLGLALVERSDKAAETYFRNAIRFEPEFAAAHSNLGNFLAGTSDYPQAAYEFQKAIAVDPTYAEAHHSYGLLLELTQAYDKALIEFREAVKLDPKSALAHNDLGDLLAAGKNTSDAQQEYRAAVRINPSFYEAHLSLGKLLAAKGESAEARTHFQKAAESPDPDLRRAALEALH